MVEPASAALDVSSDDHEIQAAQQRTWADRTALGQTTAWDAGRDARANGQLVDAYG